MFQSVRTVQAPIVIQGLTEVSGLPGCNKTLLFTESTRSHGNFIRIVQGGLFV